MSDIDKLYIDNTDQIHTYLPKIEDVQFRLADFLSKILIASNTTDQLNYCGCFRVLLGKIKINIESINAIFPLLQKDLKFKISINSLYRCIVDDIINFLYLFNFLDLNDSNQVSLGNELNILQKEFLLSIIDGFTEKLTYDGELNILSDDQTETIKKDLENIFNNNPHLICDNGKGKQNSDIRTGTNLVFIERIKSIGNSGSFLSSNFKLKYIEKSDEQMKSQYKQLKYLFNYYTQYQHFNPESTKLINKNLNHDIYNFIATITEILVILEISVHFLNLESPDFLKAQFVGLSNYISRSFNN